MIKLNQHGFHLAEFIILVVVVGAVGGAGYTVKKKQDAKKEPVVSQTTEAKVEEPKEPVRWQFNEQTNHYEVISGNAPECKEPFKFDFSPIDVSKATNVLYPGQYRGMHYKAHGGFRIDDGRDGKIDVKLPMDAKLTGVVRYYEGTTNDIQYLLTFESDCGIAFRFDHLYALAPKFQEVAETTPAPKKDDTRNLPLQNPVEFKAGEVVATQVGLPGMKNFGFDFGVYDFRKRNEISKNTQWANLHMNQIKQDWFGVCWFDMLPGDNAKRTTELSEIIINPSKPNQISDYCANAGKKTLDVNGGRPTDG